MSVKPKKSKADAWNEFADAGRALLVGSAVVAPLWRKDYQSSFNGLTALLATYAATNSIKAFWSERRPNGQDNNSFPSEHAADCFAAAAILHRDWRNSFGPFAVGIATAVSMARVFSAKHHIVDVVAGAAIGMIAGEMAADYRTSSSLGPISGI